MTSSTVAAALVRDLRFDRPRASVAQAPKPAPVAEAEALRFALALDFDSARTWPDLPFDPASPEAQYPPGDRPPLVAILDEAARLMVERAPLAFDFIDAQLDFALLRRSDLVGGAASASNRSCIGLCVLTNLHRQPDAVQIAMEGLLHESIHQYLYRAEQAEGNFCDLAELPTFRSPWSGARLPLHSLVHASLVWFGLLGMWREVASATAQDDTSVRARERIAHCRFGFAFLDDLIGSPSFPRMSVVPWVLRSLHDLTAAARLR